MINVRNEISKVFGSDIAPQLVDELVANFDGYTNRAKLRADIFSYLRSKTGLKSNHPRGHKEYWMLRGFSSDEAESRYKLFSDVYSISIESMMKKRGWTRDEAEEFQRVAVEKRKYTFKHTHTEDEVKAINASKGCNSLYNIARIHGDDDALAIYNQRRAALSLNVSLDGFISRHGNERGKKLYDDFCKGLKFSNSLNGYVAKYGQVDGVERWAKRRKRSSRAKTLARYIEIYGDKVGRARFSKRNEVWLDTLRSRDDYADICKRRGLSMEDGIAKYGPTWPTIIASRRPGRVSTESKKFFIPTYKFCRRLGLSRSDIYWGIGGSEEWFLRAKNCSVFYLYDFTIPKLKLIVEYNGVAFHPKSPTQDWKPAYKSMNTADVYENDLRKKALAESLGYKIVVVWSDSDFPSEHKRLEDIIREKNNDYLQRIL